MDQILFTVFSALAVLAALLAITRKNAVASACWLVVMFFGLAAVFVLLEAFFVATVQILVYAGAIMVLFLFVIMLLDLRTVELASRSSPRLKVLGVLLAGGVLAGMAYALRDATDSPRVADRVALTLVQPAPPPEEGAGAKDVSEKSTRTPLPLTEVDPPQLPAAKGKSSGVVVDRAYAAQIPGTVPAEGPAGAEAGKPGPSKTIVVRVAPAGDVSLWLEGKHLPIWRLDPATPAPERHAVIPLPGAPEGTALDLVVRRGGLEASPAGSPDGSPRGIGMALFERWLLPFEIASILLTGAIFGAVVLTKRKLA